MHDHAEQSSPKSPSTSELSRQQTLPAYDDASARSLLHKGSFATTNDYVKSGQNEKGEEPRQRTGISAGKGAGMSAGIQRLWHKKSVLSQWTASTFDGNFAHGKPGLWSKQMLVDRSLRSMAVFTAVCAVIMWIVVFSYLGPFSDRLNPNSTSVGRKDGESCSEAETRNVATHLFINIVSAPYFQARGSRFASLGNRRSFRPIHSKL